MPPKTRTPWHGRPTRLALAAFFLASLSAGPWAQNAAPTPHSPLKALFDAAWARQPEAQALQARQDAVQAQRRAAAAWTPEPPALEARLKTDRFGRHEGAREQELALTVPLWLPGERHRAGALAEAEATALDSQARAAQLRLAATLREAWWHAQRTGLDADMAQAALDSARRTAGDVARRTRAGELARADQHQADAAVAAAEASWAQAQGAATAARLALQALSGAPTALRPPTPGQAAPEAEPEPSASDLLAHPARAELRDRATLADRRAALVAAQTRANPELSLATSRERSSAGERDASAVTLALRVPFGAGARHDAQGATARAEAAEAQARLALEDARLQAELDAARARVDAARAQQVAAERRARLAVETRGFFERSFQLGETDLPTRLRVEAEATEAERQAARSRMELAAAVSAWRQALGLLPQ